MTGREGHEQKPVISLVESGELARDAGFRKLVTAVKAGMEEESVPWSEMEEKGSSTAAELALQGARSSKLGVGIGIGADLSMAVYFHHGDNSQPLFSVPGQQVSVAVARLLGANAARLVKKMPFKDLPRLTGQ